VIAASLLTLVLAAGPLPEPGGPPSSALPPEVAGLSFDQKLGAQIPLDATFRDEAGREVELADFIGKRPTVLVLAYLRCPQLCTLVLNGLLDGLKDVPYEAGKEFEVVIVSFDPRETPELAAAKKESYLAGYARPGAEQGWHFLTGERDQIDRLAEAVGFRYAFDPKHDRFNHPSGVVILTPDGRVSRYLFGIRFPHRDLKLGIVEASEGRVGSLVDQLLLFCFHYDRDSGSYTLNAVRIAGAVTVVMLAAFLVSLWRREAKRPTPQPGATG
jgi:protein SCO1/2